MKILFMTNVPTPYRSAFFNELGNWCELTVCFEGRYSTERHKDWVGEKASTYREIYLHSIRTGTDRFLAFGIKKLLSEAWDRIIVGCYSTPTARMAIDYMKYHGISFFIEADGGFIKEEPRWKYHIKKHYISAAKGWFSSSFATTDYLVHYGAIKEKCIPFHLTSVNKEDIAEANRLHEMGKDKLRQKLHMGEKRIVLSVGRFSYKKGYGKGFDYLIDCAEKLDKDTGIYIVGDEPTKEFLKITKDRHITNLHFVGFKEKTELYKYYAAADVFVLMSRGDVWGMVIGEAMMFGLPVIASDKCLAAKTLVTDGENGFVISLDSVDLLPEKVKLLLDNEELRCQFGKVGKCKMEAYTIENMAIDHLK